MLKNVLDYVINFKVVSQEYLISGKVFIGQLEETAVLEWPLDFWTV